MENSGIEMLAVILTKFQVAIAPLVKGVIATALAVFLDSALLITTAYVFIGLHVLSGWMVMGRGGVPWNSDKWFKTSMKLLWFPVVIISTKWLRAVYDIQLPIGNIVAGFLSVNEFKGFIDNSGKLMGIDIWNVISDQVDWKKIFSKVKGK
jgi:hypothetical protein